MLKQNADGIYALPMPGGFNITPYTWSLLAWLAERSANPTQLQQAGKRHLPAQQVVVNWGKATRVTAMCFPRVTSQAVSQLAPQSQALALAQLMENSLDRWDRGSLAEHIGLLEALSDQAPAFHLQLGQDIDVLPKRLADLCHEGPAGLR